MKGDLLEVRVILHALEAVRGVLLILGGDVTGHTGNTACLLFCALQDDLHPVSFSFLCHNSQKLNKVNKALCLGVLKCCIETVLLDDTHTFGGHLKGDETLLCL